MKSVVWHESEIETIPQPVVVMKQREVMIELKRAAKAAFADDEHFGAFWADAWEDMWMDAKRRDLKTTKLKSQDVWYAKSEDGLALILSDIAAVAADGVAKWREDHVAGEPDYYDVGSIGDGEA